MKYFLPYCCAISMVALTACFGCRTQLAPTLEGHALGEPITSFVAESEDLRRIVSNCKGSLSSECTMANQLVTSTYSGIVHCTSQTKSVDACRDSRGEFIFKNGRLAAIEFVERNTWEPALNTLTATFGKPSEIVKGSGTSADAISANWSTSTYRLSLSGFQNDPSSGPTVCVILQTLDHYAKAAEQQAKSQSEHNEILTDYRKTLKSLDKDQTGLIKDQNGHKNLALISSDKMMLTMDESSIKMYELLLSNEVREDESSEAVY